MIEEFVNKGIISDGWHTFDELYEHRAELFIALCRKVKENVWRSKLQSDGIMFENMFLLGVGKNKGEQITYHLPLSKWEEVNFAETLEKAPEFDGHTSNDNIERLKRI